jgi:hypothetical protein
MPNGFNGDSDLARPRNSGIEKIQGYWNTVIAHYLKALLMPLDPARVDYWGDEINAKFPLMRQIPRGSKGQGIRLKGHVTLKRKDYEDRPISNIQSLVEDAIPNILDEKYITILDDDIKTALVEYEKEAILKLNLPTIEFISGFVDLIMDTPTEVLIDVKPLLAQLLAKYPNVLEEIIIKIKEKKKAKMTGDTKQPPVDGPPCPPGSRQRP